MSTINEKVIEVGNVKIKLYEETAGYGYHATTVYIGGIRKTTKFGKGCVCPAKLTLRNYYLEDAVEALRDVWRGTRTILLDNFGNASLSNNQA